MHKISKIVFILTSKCLHRCSYCFDRQYYPLEDIDYTAEDIKIFLDLNYDYLDTNGLDFYIHGGDLFLAKNLDSILELLYNYNYPTKDIFFHFFFSTLPIEAFTRYPILYTSSLGISIDGPEFVHNLNRKRIDGKNSFKELEYLLYMDHIPYLHFQSVVSSNNIQYIETTEEFFKKFNVSHSYAVDRRPKYWSAESLELLKKIPVPLWYSGSYEDKVYSEQGKENYLRKYIIFSDGSINLFGDEFRPEHELKYFCNITEHQPLSLFYENAIKNLKLCDFPCSRCSSHCNKYSILNAITAEQFIPVTMIDSYFQNRKPLADCIKYFNFETMQETTLKETFFNVAPFDGNFEDQLIKEN